MFALGILADSGKEQPDDTEAFEWYRKAADEDHVEAMFKVAEFLEVGRGTPQNAAKAQEWRERAKEAERKGATDWLDQHEAPETPHSCEGGKPNGAYVADILGAHHVTISQSSV